MIELTFNIWFIVDIGTNLSKYAILKPYSIGGSDEKKIEVMKTLAETDYLTEERFDFAINAQTIFENKTAKGCIPGKEINHFFNESIKIFTSKMEDKLPPIFSFKGDYLGENKVEKQKFPKEPLYILTILMENEYGELKPFTTIENKEWAENERTRMILKSKSSQN